MANNHWSAQLPTTPAPDGTSSLVSSGEISRIDSDALRQGATPPVAPPPAANIPGISPDVAAAFAHGHEPVTPAEASRLANLRVGGEHSIEPTQERTGGAGPYSG